MESKDKMVSYTEKDENGKTRETFGRFEKYKDGKSFDEKIKNLVNKINNGSTTEKKSNTAEKER